MNYEYANRKRVRNDEAQKTTAPAQPALDALRSGAAAPTAEQMGRRVDLPDIMRAKMENAFGADLSAVKLYESEAVADAGAEAVTQGSNIAFAPGMLDFSSFGGQALLGHEISHVVSQARGEASGGGFLNDYSLDARADREGAMAAAGQQIAMPAAAVTTVSAAPAAGPMQASKKAKRAAADAAKRQKATALSSQVGGGSTYSSEAMQSSIDALAPVAKGEIQKSNKALDDGNRYFYMRGGGKAGDARTPYLQSLKAAGSSVTANTIGSMLTEQESLPMLQQGQANTYKQIEQTARLQGKKPPKELEAYDQRALVETQRLLAGLEQDSDAMDALKKSQSLYTGFGTFGEQNEDGSRNIAGMNGGREEAAHRAINDLVLRSLGPQLLSTTQQMQASGDLKDEEVKKAINVSQAMTHMQANVMGKVMNPDRDRELSESELAMQQLYHDFFERNGMLAEPEAAAPAAAASETAAPDASMIDALAQTTEQFDADLGMAPDASKIDELAQTTEQFDADLAPKPPVEQAPPVPADPRKAQLQRLKANQGAFLPSFHLPQSGGEFTEHQLAYNAMAARNSPTNPNRVAKDVDGAFKWYVADWDAFNQPLREGKSLDEMDAGVAVRAMDRYMASEEGQLADDLTTFRGIDDNFMKFLFSQAGIKERKYLDKHGKIDHDKIAKHKLLEQLAGTTFQDKGYVSTTTNEGFANDWTMGGKVEAAWAKAGINPDTIPKEQREKAELAMMQSPEIMRGSHIMNMHSKAGTKGAFVSTEKSKQSEFLLDRGQSYRINSASRRADGSYAFDVDVLGVLEEEAKKKGKK